MYRRTHTYRCKERRHREREMYRPRNRNLKNHVFKLFNKKDVQTLGIKILTNIPPSHVQIRIKYDTKELFLKLKNKITNILWSIKSLKQLSNSPQCINDIWVTYNFMTEITVMPLFQLFYTCKLPNTESKFWCFMKLWFIFYFVFSTLRPTFPGFIYYWIPDGDLLLPIFTLHLIMLHALLNFDLKWANDDCLWSLNCSSI